MPEDPSEREDSGGNHPRYSLIAAASLCLPLLALAISAAVFPTSVPFRVFSVAALFAIQFIVVVYLTAGPAALGLTSERAVETVKDSPFDPETEERLLLLEEAGNLLGGSLKLRDMFRLVANKAADIVPFEDPALLVSGSDGREPRTIALGSSDDRVPASFRELAAEAEGKRTTILRELGENAGSIRLAAIPLSKGGDVFAVMIGSLAEEKKRDREIRILLDAIAERVAPVIFAAISIDQKEVNALVDVLTGLPNGRAFDLVLANRLAEAERVRKGARLMVLAIDIKGFADINSRFGHGTGDRMLVFAAEIIKEQLRKMDLVARTRADEFLAILPAAGKGTSGVIIGRIKGEFRETEFELPNGESIFVEINVGSSVFGTEAFSAPDLITLARADKDGSKPSKSNQVIRFPTKHGN